MIDGKKIIAFTPCGRKRYMDLLTAHVAREHERGHIDQWVLFQNAFTQADAANAAQLAERYPWCVALQPISAPFLLIVSGRAQPQWPR